MKSSQREISQVEIDQATKTYLEWSKQEGYTPKSLVIMGLSTKGDSMAVMQVVIGRRNWIARNFEKLAANSKDMLAIMTEIVGAKLFKSILDEKMDEAIKAKAFVTKDGKLQDSYVN